MDFLMCSCPRQGTGTWSCGITACALRVQLGFRKPQYPSVNYKGFLINADLTFHWGEKTVQILVRGIKQ